ncbi:uncharacterized protein [Triticum aestivum]|uniref:uncharacterized protein n=1 Tax=Triticum aestivum TaxID=4565 RepID=UPI001D00C00A|nr:uncharacterized protein LOC123092048 [Triticum aestivum]XP_044369651.1 uncharacterized protein LOC123092048 [Triticum aestivum]
MVEWTCRGEEGGRREWEGLVGSLLMVLEIARIVQSGFRSVCCSYKLTQVLIGVDLPPHDFPYNHNFSWLGCSDPPPHRLPHPHRQRPSWHRPAAGAMAKKPLPSSSDGCRHAVLRTYALMTRLAQGLTNQHATSLHVDKRSNRHIYKMTAVKQEEADTTSDISGGQITHDEPLCQKHNKPFEYIHRPRKASQSESSKARKSI